MSDVNKVVDLTFVEVSGVDGCKDSVFTQLMKARGADQSANESRFQHAQCEISKRPEHDFTTKPLPKLVSSCAPKRSIEIVSINAGPSAKGQGVDGDSSATPPVHEHSEQNDSGSNASSIVLS